MKLIVCIFFGLLGLFVRRAQGMHNGVKDRSISGAGKSTTVELVLQGIAAANDSATLWLHSVLPGETLGEKFDRRLQSRIVNGRCVFAVNDLAGIRYFSVDVGNSGGGENTKDRIVQNCLVEPGDALLLKVSKGTTAVRVEYSGTGAAKNSCRLSADSVVVDGSPLIHDEEYRYLPGNSNEKWLKARLELLASCRADMSADAYDLVRLDIISENEYLRGKAFKDDLLLNGAKYDMERMRNYFFSYLAVDTMHVPDRLKVLSEDFVMLSLQRVLLNQLLKSGTGQPDYFAVVDTVFNGYSGILRDVLLSYAFFHWRGYLAGRPGIYKRTLEAIEDPFYKKVFTELGASIAGGKAFDFRLPDASGRYHRLSDYRGKVVFVDFWFTGCDHCSHFFKSQVRPLIEKYKSDTGVVFVSISVDRSRQIWLRSVASGRYTDEDGINLYTDGLGSNHAIIQHYNLSGYPFPMMIDQRGYIVAPEQGTFRKSKVIEETIDRLLQVDNIHGGSKRGVAFCIVK